MTVSDDAGKKKLSNLSKLQKVGYGAIFVAAGLATGVARFSDSEKLLKQLFGSVGSPEWSLAVLQVVLLAFTLALVLGWFYWTSYELDLLTEHVDYMPPVRPRDYLVIPLAGSVLGLLIYFSNRVVVYAFIYVICDLVASLAVKDVNEGVELAVDSTRERRGDKQSEKEILDSIETYYLKRPHIRRILSGCAVRFVALLLALYGAFSRPGQDSYTKIVVDAPVWPTVAAYVLLLATGLVFETQIFFWRGKRDRTIRAAILQEDRLKVAALKHAGVPGIDPGSSNKQKDDWGG